MKIQPAPYHRSHSIAGAIAALALLSTLGAAQAAVFKDGQLESLQMLPLLVFELIWNAIWPLVIAHPLWRGGAVTRKVERSCYAIMAGVVLTPLVLAWRYVAHRYSAKPAQRWR